MSTCENPGYLPGFLYLRGAVATVPSAIPNVLKFRRREFPGFSAVHSRRIHTAMLTLPVEFLRLGFEL